MMTDYEAVFNAITADPRYQQNLDWGKPRSGHPEGTIPDHIAELERNLKAFTRRVSESDYWRLKVLIHTHDTFKGAAKAGVPIRASNSRASLARAFLTEFCDHADMLQMLQYHDEPIALWRQFVSKGRCNRRRLAALLTNIQDWDLFLAFNIVDGCTPGKDRDGLRWFFQQVASKVTSKFTEADIL